MARDQALRYGCGRIIRIGDAEDDLVFWPVDKKGRFKRPLEIVLDAANGAENRDGRSLFLLPTTSWNEFSFPAG